MKQSPETQKERLLHEAEAMIDELLVWEEGHPRPTMSEIEEAILQLRQAWAADGGTAAPSARGKASRSWPDLLSLRAGDALQG